MKLNKLTRQIIAEFIGTTVFLAAVVGATASASPFGGVAVPVALGLMMVLFGDLSGGHFNPVISLFFFARRQITGAQFGGYVAAQLAGSVAGVALGATIWNQGANLTFNTGDILATPAVIVSELVGTTVLVWLFAKFAGSGKGNLAAPVVAAWVFAAGTFTSTHAIANPAVTFGRFFTAVSGAGIQANVGVELMLAQVGGALLALILLTFVTEKGLAKAKKRKKA